jgi:hypothetical protein
MLRRDDAERTPDYPLRAARLTSGAAARRRVGASSICSAIPDALSAGDPLA